MRILFTSLVDPPGAPAASGWRSPVKGRVLLVAACLAVWTVVILGRLVQLQVFQRDEMRARADAQQHSMMTLPAMRGEIVDRHGEILAYSVDSADIDASPKHVKDPALTASRLCGALGDCGPADRAALARALGTQALWLRVRKATAVTPDQLAAVRALDLSAVGFFPRTLRYYPKMDLAAHLLGYVGTENTGLAGLEARLNREILGQDGRVLVQVDARAERMLTRVEQAPTAGATVELTIDLGLQHIAERELRAGVLAAGAQAGSAIIMDPASGEILALASYPTFNPNDFGAYSDDTRRNRAIQDAYEPGSTFKIVTAAAALEEHLIAPTDLIDTRPGTIKFPGRRPITEAKGHNYGVLSFEDVIVKSSNVGAVRAGLKIGAERMDRYMRRFGFGQLMTPDFRGESPGRVHPLERLNDSELASVSMGYGVMVTPVQMAAAVSAVANGGTVFQPHVVRATIRDGVRTPIEPKALRRAISPRTAATITAIMEGVVERGTAKAAGVPHYQVAGKTGTAEKVVNGVYSKTDHNASFVGFVPSRRPAFTILVVIDTPRTSHYGGVVAAPVFRNIAAAALRHAGVPPSIDPMPAVIVTDAESNVRPRPVRATSLPVLQHAGGRALMPDVRGLAARDALRLMNAAGLWARVRGDGFVAVQTPAPGEPIEPGGWGVLELRRAPPAPTPMAPTPPGGAR